MRLSELVAVSNAVANTSSRLDKVARLADLLKRLAPEEIPIAAAFLSGSPVQGRIGVAGSMIAGAQSAAPAEEPTLDLHEVHTYFGRIAGTSGRGAAGTRAQLLSDLFARATHDERDFLIRLLFGELRQGALEGVLVEAIACAAGVPADRVRRAAMLAGTLPPVAAAALTGGDAGLGEFTLGLLRPIQPMLAETAADVGEALNELGDGDASFEYKLDGARIQVHKAGDEVRVFTRNLRDVSARTPEVVEAVRAMAPRELILDGEAIALRPDGSPHPFQITMRRFGRKLDVDRIRETLPLSPVFFDCLFIDGQPLIDEPHARRMAALAGAAPAPLVVPRIVTASPAGAEAFLARALAAGHEGVMAKAVGGRYAAGRRGQAWLKIKPTRTLDLVILAAEWGHGRRRGTLSNLHLGARDEERGGFVMLGKTFKGLTDELLRWQTARFLELATERGDWVVHVRPELVVEIAFDGVQTSPRYPGGVALRFARVLRYREDKSAAEADTIDDVRRIHMAASERT
jgi:DNA ligase-1